MKDFENLIRMRLVEEGYSLSEATNQTIARLSSLKGKSLELLKDWLSNNLPVEFDPINGIDSTYLRNNLGMKEPAIIIAYEMLLREPEENSNYFKELAKGRNLFTPNKNL